ncbi:MAG: S8 family serine peptidase [Bacteroidota bacterium]
MYTLGFVLVLSGLVGLMLDRKAINMLKYATVPGLGLWLAGVWTSVSGWGGLFGQAFTDLIFFTGAALLFRAIGKTGRFAIPAALIAMLTMAGFHQAFEPQSSALPVQEAAQSTTITLATDGELLVELSQETNEERWKRWIGAQGWTTRRAFSPLEGERTDLDDYFLVDISKAELSDIKQIELLIMDSGLADWVETNEVIKLELAPAKKLPGLNKLLGVNDPSVSEQWAMDALKMDQLYALLTSGKVKAKKQTLVAILDTGVDAKHEDLKANFRSISKKHNDDPQGHGTHCAGIAGAVTNNSVGVASMARTGDYFNITSVKALRSGGSGTQKDIIDAIITAVDGGADVLSLSLGGFSTQSRQRAYSEAVRYATDKGAIVVAAAGNSNRDAATYTPVNATGMIGVAAIDNQLQRAVFSNKVNKIEMAVAAPGVGIFSTKPNNNYAAHNGTSMATPFVSGLLGLMKSIRPELTNKEAYKILYETGIETKNTNLTGRLIQPAAAVSRLLEEI